MSVKKISFYIFFLLFLFLTNKLFFSVRRINCHLENSTAELDELNYFLEENFKGRSLFFYRFENDLVWDELLEKGEYSQVYQLESYTKTLPNQLNLNLIAKLPDYRFQYREENGETKSFLINQNSKLKNDHPDLELLTIVYQGDQEIVDKSQSFLEESFHQKFLNLAIAVREFELPARELIWQNQSLLKMDIGKSWLVIMDSETDFRIAMELLSYLLKDEENLKKVHGHAYLDLRFRLPVVRDEI